MGKCAEPCACDGAGHPEGALRETESLRPHFPAGIRRMKLHALSRNRPNRTRQSLHPNGSAAAFHSRWTIVLAAGEGKRLCSLTRALHGEDLPKQYAQIHAHQSLLQETVSRASRWSSPSRIVVVVAADREEIAKAQLRAHGPVDVVAQPQNLGTGPGILLPLSRVLAKDPSAHVVILPSDHFVRAERAFAESVLRAEEASRKSDAVTLIGAVPDHAETQYGWIVPEKTTGKTLVSRFHEKPSAPIAECLLKSGALWNTFIMTGPARRLWDLASKHLPAQSAMFASYSQHIGTERELASLADLYGALVPADFSRDVIEKADGLGVETLESCGWSDWGTPERVMRSLQGTSDWIDLTTKLMSRTPIQGTSIRWGYPEYSFQEVRSCETSFAPG